MIQDVSPSPAAVAVIEADFRPIARQIRELQRKHDWPLGPGVGGALLYTICTLQDTGVEEGDALLSMLKTMAASIAEGRASEMIEGN